MWRLLTPGWRWEKKKKPSCWFRMISDGCVLYLHLRIDVVQSVPTASTPSAPDRYNSHYQLFSHLLPIQMPARSMQNNLSTSAPTAQTITKRTIDDVKT
jgi:hypothetical protein